MLTTLLVVTLVVNISIFALLTYFFLAFKYSLDIVGINQKYIRNTGTLMAKYLMDENVYNKFEKQIKDSEQALGKYEKAYEAVGLTSRFLRKRGYIQPIY